MSKGKFEPGKRVLLLAVESSDHSLYTGSIQTLGEPSQFWENHWLMAPNLFSPSGRILVWHKQRLLLLDPDESPEQSLEAMRDLMQTKEEKVTT